MERQRLKVGQPIDAEQFEALGDSQLARVVSREDRDYFAGEGNCADGCVCLHDGTAWSFFKGGFLDD